MSEKIYTIEEIKEILKEILKDFSVKKSNIIWFICKKYSYIKKRYRPSYR